MTVGFEGIKTVAIETLGCKLNLADSEAMARQLTAAGFRVVEPGGRPDIYVLNTCTVTHVADRKSRHSLRMARRRRPDGYVVAAGCYAQRAPAEVSRTGGADLVVGNMGKPRLAESIIERLGLAGYSQTTPHTLGQDFPSVRTRAFVKIQEGCNDCCSYCIIPQTRGHSRSMSKDNILDEIRQRVAEGCKEVVLTGTQLGDYGLTSFKARRRNGGWRWQRRGNPLAFLVKGILSETELPRLRLSSLQPQDVTSDLLQLWDDPRLCRHLHIPLQSGSDPVLRQMRRRYTAAQYAATVNDVRKAIPQVAITTDVMVGFPGEGEEDFQGSYHFCQEMAFSSIHVFPFSPRDGTSAARMGDKIAEAVKKERTEKMLRLAREMASRFREGLLGEHFMVLWEENKERGASFPDMPNQKGVPLWSGLTDNYVRVYTQHDAPLLGRILLTTIKGEDPPGLWGEVNL